MSAGYSVMFGGQSLVQGLGFGERSAMWSVVGLICRHYVIHGGADAHLHTYPPEEDFSRLKRWIACRMDAAEPSREGLAWQARGEVLGLVGGEREPTGVGLIVGQDIDLSPFWDLDPTHPAPDVSALKRSHAGDRGGPGGSTVSWQKGGILKRAGIISGTIVAASFLLAGLRLGSRGTVLRPPVMLGAELGCRLAGCTT